MESRLAMPSAQKLFFILLGFGIFVVNLLLNMNGALLLHINHQPKAFKSRLFVTCQCGHFRRLGNAMFSFAAAIGIAKLNNMTAILERTSRLVGTFRIIEPISRDMANTMAYTHAINYFEYRRHACAYDRRTRDIFRLIGRRPNHVRLIGFFQSWRYFDTVTDRIRQNFVFEEHILTKAKLFLSSVKPVRWIESGVQFVFVGVHVRRGDMIEPHFRRAGYTVATSDYFRSAMRYFANRYQHVLFVVCSDSIEWSRSSLPVASDIGANVDIVFSENRLPEVDLAILSQCNHTVMSVGSFGWWAAWLANGVTIYYADWPRPFSELDFHVNKYDYFPKHWIPMR